MDRCCVFGLENVSYPRRDGEIVNRLDMYYFSILERLDSRLEKGYRILKKDIYGDFNRGDFEAIPGVYDLSFRPVRGRLGKVEPKLHSIDLLDTIDFRPMDEYYLILGAKKYDTTINDNTIKGVKFFTLDPTQPVKDSSFVGYPLIEASINKGDFSKGFQGFPAYYDIEFEQIRGRGGESQFVAKAVRFIAPFDPKSVPSAA